MFAFWPRALLGRSGISQVATELLARVHDAVVVLDDQRRIVVANPRFLAWIEVSAAEVEGIPLAQFWEDPGRWEEWWHSMRLQGGGSVPEVLDLRTRDGDPVPVEAQYAPLVGGWGRLRGAIVVFHDLRPRRVLERLLGEDALTGTLSRPSLLDRLEAEVSRAQKYGTALGAVLVDVDGFRGLNDQWGQAFGDEVLRVAAAELREALGPGTVVGRWGSEEFLVLLPGSSFEEVEVWADRLRGHFAQRLFAPSGHEVIVTLSLGVSLLRSGGRDTAVALLARLEAALERAQGHGFNRVESSP